MLRRWVETIVVLAATLLVSSCFDPRTSSNIDAEGNRLARQLGLATEVQVVARESDGDRRYFVLEDGETAFLIVSMGGKILASDRCPDLRHDGHIGCGFLGTAGPVQGIEATYGFRKDSSTGVRISVDGNELTVPLTSQGGFLYVRHTKSGAPLGDIKIVP